MGKELSNEWNIVLKLTLFQRGEFYMATFTYSDRVLRGRLCMKAKQGRLWGRLCVGFEKANFNQWNLKTKIKFIHCPFAEYVLIIWKVKKICKLETIMSKNKNKRMELWNDFTLTFFLDNTWFVILSIMVHKTLDSLVFR